MDSPTARPSKALGGAGAGGRLKKWRGFWPNFPKKHFWATSTSTNQYTLRETVSVDYDHKLLEI